MKIYVGTSGYAYKEWKVKFYPENIVAKKMLNFYSERLSTVEINNTFYRMPTESTLMSWAQQVPDDFIFALKAPQIITHIKRLKNVSTETDYLFRTLTTLDRKLGPTLFQFPASFRANRVALADFLDLIPDKMLCAFEFRNPSWLEADTLSLLRERQHSLCIADSDDNPANEIIETAKWGYIRLRRSDYTNADLSQWKEKILAHSWETAFVFFKHEQDARGPEMAMHFGELIVQETDV